MVIPLNWWDFGEFRLIYGFDAYRELLLLLDPQLRLVLQERQEKWREAASSAEEAVRGELYSILYEEEEREEELKSILFNSFFAASFALFEHKLRTICEEAKTFTGSPFSIDDIRPSSLLDSTKKYLTRLGVDFPAQDQDSDWQEIKDYAGVRNRLMHEGGRLRDRDSLTAYAVRKQIVSGGNEPELVLTRSFCEEAVDNLENFLRRVYRAFDALKQK